jgi:GxxExxY protein
MNTDEHRSDGPHAEVTFAIIGGAMEVLNGLGHGLNEKPYENALLIELGQRQLKVDQQKRYEVVYKGVVVGDYIPDLIAGDAVVVDTKVIDRISDGERGQLLNYLRITKLKVGLILNFKRPKLEWERLVL